MISPKRNYEDLSIIGKGAYGTVFKAFDAENDRIVALKRVRIINDSEDKGVPVSTLREITLLKQLDNIAHPNIVRYVYLHYIWYKFNASIDSTDV
ncbi:cyclin-dependent kinase 4-like [Hydractinia symbiolongicarpus]|uniref:cyclin-dependent kinase 4-like n=1 Tax=Hydractinia symbiolongicarpus TaxID=13093 RepID=UPI00254ABE0E|nr:cyclin-dependent kinase 4-like [Hydractinia symbiolongicarpus]